MISAIYAILLDIYSTTNSCIVLPCNVNKLTTTTTTTTGCFIYSFLYLFNKINAFQYDTLLSRHQMNLAR